MAYGAYQHMVLYRRWSVKWRNTNTNRYIVVPPLNCFTCGSFHTLQRIGGGAKQLVGGVMSKVRVYTCGRSYQHGELDGVNISIQQ